MQVSGFPLSPGTAVPALASGRATRPARPTTEVFLGEHQVPDQAEPAERGAPGAEQVGPLRAQDLRPARARGRGRGRSRGRPGRLPPRRPRLRQGDQQGRDPPQQRREPQVPPRRHGEQRRRRVAAAAHDPRAARHGPPSLLSAVGRGGRYSTGTASLGWASRRPSRIDAATSRTQRPARRHPVTRQARPGLFSAMGSASTSHGRPASVTATAASSAASAAATSLGWCDSHAPQAGKKTIGATASNTTISHRIGSATTPTRAPTMDSPHDSPSQASRPGWGTVTWLVRPAAPFPPNVPIVLRLDYAGGGERAGFIFYVGRDAAFAAGLNTAWYPEIEEGPLRPDGRVRGLRGTGTLSVTVPRGWRVRSEERRVGKECRS